jgi:hypothetical protein
MSPPGAVKLIVTEVDVALTKVNPLGGPDGVAKVIVLDETDVPPAPIAVNAIV